MIRAIVAPLVGGVIGYITNDLAIKMLFRPRRAVYIGKLHVPFTPGLIPSQQGRIAQSIGSVISKQLLNEETLRQTALSEQAIEKLQRKVRELFIDLSIDQRTVRELLRGHWDDQSIDMGAAVLEKKLTDMVVEKLQEAKVGAVLVDSLSGDLTAAIAQNRLLHMIVDENMQRNLKAAAAEKIDQVVAEKAPEVVANVLANYGREILNLRLCDLYARFADKKDDLIRYGTDLYVSILSNNLERVLRAVNIEQIVVDKINGFDPAQLEAMIFGIMKRELRAIVYLGAVLGFFMGFINLLW